VPFTHWVVVLGFPTMPAPQYGAARLIAGEASPVSGSDANTTANAVLAAQRRTQCLIADLYFLSSASESDRGDCRHEGDRVVRI
jgi:hypothetical protein